MCQIRNQRNDSLGAELLENLRRHDGLSQTRSGQRSNNVGCDVVFLALLGKSLSKADKRKLSGRVVGLAKVTVEASSRSSVDNAAKLLLAEVGPSSLGDLVGAVNVDSVNEIPVLVGQVLERNIAENSGVVDDNVNGTEGLDSGLDNLVTVLD